MYELVRDDGTVDKVKVLKAKHKYALMTKMQREWEVGRRISSLKNPERAMPGYMSVGAAVCTETGNFKGRPQSFSRLLLLLEPFTAGFNAHIVQYCLVQPCAALMYDDMQAALLMVCGMQA